MSQTHRLHSNRSIALWIPLKTFFFSHFCTWIVMANAGLCNRIRCISSIKSEAKMKKKKRKTCLVRQSICGFIINDHRPPTSYPEEIRIVFIWRMRTEKKDTNNGEADAIVGFVLSVLLQSISKVLRFLRCFCYWLATISMYINCRLVLYDFYVFYVSAVGRAECEQKVKSYICVCVCAREVFWSSPVDIFSIKIRIRR